MARCGGMVLALGWAIAACGGEGGGTEWAGTMDTLPGGQVVVTNPATGVWDSTTAWRVVEELRIGAEDGDGPEVLGQVGLVFEDAGGRIWVLESSEQHFKVFDRQGRFVRTVGRQGGGPGEFAQVAGIAPLPDGRLLVVDPQGARLSYFDTAGTYLTSHTTSGGFSIYPWPGGVDREGFLYHPAPLADNQSGFRFVLLKQDSLFNVIDTLFPPRTPGTPDFLELRSATGFIRASVPFSPGMQWRLTSEGDVWLALTGEYTLARLSARGDTLRVVRKPFTATPVSEADKDSAVAALQWFTNQGGRVDRGRIPSTKPALQTFQVAEDGYLWVEATQRDAALTRRAFDIFDPEGRFLGTLRLPFPLSAYPIPQLRGDRLIAVTQDDAGVPYVVRARIERP